MISVSPHIASGAPVPSYGLLIPYSAVVSKLGLIGSLDCARDKYQSAAALLRSSPREKFDKLRHLLFINAVACEVSWCEEYLRGSQDGSLGAVNKRTAPILLSSYRRIHDIPIDVCVLKPQETPLDYRGCLNFLVESVDELLFKDMRDITDARFKQLGDFALDLYKIKYERPL